MKDKYVKELLNKPMTRKEFVRSLATASLGAVGLYDFFSKPATKKAEQGGKLPFGVDKFGV